MKLLLFAIVGLLAVRTAPAAQPRLVRPFEAEATVAPASRIDTLVLAALKKRGLEPANLCSDEVFLRRVYLDVIGTLPEPAQVDRFLQDRSPDKRAVLIDELLGRPEFADYWAMKWSDLLRVKAEFPINLWPNAVQAYHRWIHDAIAANRPYDQFVRELLTASGSNFRVAPVNFYRAVQSREPLALAEAVALTFMCTRLESWPAHQRAHMASFFSRIQYKPTAEWKEEIICLDPAPAGVLKAVFPDGTAVEIRPDQDPREVFANWLITPQNSWFSRAIANRAWAWFLGRGIIHEPDDIRPDNPPSNPELLIALEREFVRSRYDLKALFRLILNSRTYQQSSIAPHRARNASEPGSGARSAADGSSGPDVVRLFPCYPVRRLDAEVLIDALCQIFGGGESYESAIPEPFSYIPSFQRTIQLADGSVTSQFLEMFGRPSRDTGLESERNNQPTDAQRLHLLNSGHLQRKIQQSWRLRRWVETNRRNPARLVRQVYLNILSRHPTQSELSAAQDYLQTGGLRLEDAAGDLAWALVNSKEFLYRH